MSAQMWTDELEPVLTTTQVRRLTWLLGKMDALSFLDERNQLKGMTESDAYQFAKRLAFVRYLVRVGKIHD